MVEVRERQKERPLRVESHKQRSQFSGSIITELNCPLLAVGGVGLSEIGAAVMKDVSQKTNTGHRLPIDQRNWL